MRKTIYLVSLVASILLSIVGALFKIEHWAGASNLLTLGMAVGIPFIFLGVVDVFQNKKNDFIVKAMYLTGFIFLSIIAGLIYLKTYQERN